VVDDPGARDAAQVPAQIRAVGPVGRRERLKCLGGEAVDLERLVVLELAELRAVPVRRHHQVP
jgi:hypothetical protein